MMGMKHLLKKLHIGGGGGGAVDDLRGSNLPPLPPPTSSSSSAAATVDPGSVLARGAERPRAFVGSGTRRGRNDGAGGTPEDFSFFEEEYQMQLAQAISVSYPDGREDSECAQIKAAKRISLESTPVSEGDSLVEILSQWYRNFNVLNYDEKVMDGFYDIYGIIGSHLQEKSPLLVDIQTTSIAENVDYEAVIVNRTTDLALQRLETAAVSISMQCKAMELGPSDSCLIQKIADLVVESMGGPVEDADDMLKRWTLKSHELRTSLNTIVLPLGCLEVGMSRHRALLFKVLADRIDLPCKLVKGGYYTGTDDGAVNLVKIDGQREYIIDLMGAPGALIPAEIPSCLVQNAEFDLNNFSSITEAVNDLSLALDSSLDGKRGNGVSVDAYSNSKSAGSVAEGLRVGSKEMEHMNVKEQDDMGKFEPNFTKPLPSLTETQGKTSRCNQHETPAQKMKAGDVVSVTENPEFAQKLCAVLLENGESPPLNLFSDVNILFGNKDEKNLGQTIEAKEEVHLQQGSLSPHDDTDILPSLGPQLSECSRRTTQTQNEATIQNIMGQHLEASFENKEFLSQNFCVTETIQDCSSSFVPGVANEAKVSNGVQIYQEVDSIGKVPGDPIFGSSQRVAERLTKNVEISTVLDEVAECEIPWDDLTTGERIGFGSYGEVYHADWNGTEVAVKKFLDQDLSGDALEQFRCEIKIMQRLRHPNVVLFMGAVTRPPNLSILTEFLPRGSLYRLLHRSKIQIDEKLRLKMALDVAKGMNYLHTSHPTIVHRDLKSPNLLVDKNWVVKVCDFGLSRLKHHTFLSSKSTAGTPEWMAPEVLRNEPSTEKCDVYSFGVILWELATGCIPWSGLNPMQVVGAVGFQNRRLDVPKEVDSRIADIICHCWHNDPDVRPSFAQLLTPLKKLKRLTVENS